MSQTAEEWFRTRRKFEVDSFLLTEVWPPLLYAIDVSCGGWPRSIAVRRSIERLGRVAITELHGWQQIEEIAKLIACAYKIAYQELQLPLPDSETIGEQIRSAMEMVWELPDDWLPARFSLDLNESAAGSAAEPAVETPIESPDQIKPPDQEAELNSHESDGNIEPVGEPAGKIVEVLTEPQGQ